VRLARNEAEISSAQFLRHQVFRGNPLHKDHDELDAFCDHLIVMDTSLNTMIVGTYRLLRREQAQLAGGFYSRNAFDIDALIARFPHLHVLELGRSCVLEPYRTKRTIELLWKGIWTLCQRWNIGLLCGCASFSGTDPAVHAVALSFLHHSALASGEWSITGKHAQSMNLMPLEAIDARRAFTQLPPLIKGYVRLGAIVGNGFVIDADFNTLDVFIILPVERISQRYLTHFS
jgi:L-ornithine Nalpha-acyltransferase